MESLTKQWNVLKAGHEYKEALDRTVEIFQADDNTPEADELDLLLALIKDYEDKYIVIPSINL